MKKTRVILALLLALTLIAALAPAALAEMEFFSEEKELTGEHDATVFLAGSSPVSSGDVRGILFAAGNTVSVGGAGEYALIAGNTVLLSGNVGRDAFLAGNIVTVTGSVSRDLCAAARQLEIGGSVSRDLFAAGETVVIGGEIGGNVYLEADEIRIGSDAKIGGTLRYNSSAKISAPEELLGSAVVYNDEHASEESSVQTAPSPFAKLRSAAFGYVGLILLAFALLWLTPLWEKLDGDYEGADFGSYAAAFGIGFAVLAALPPAAILLMIAGVGARPGFVLLMLYMAAIAASPVFISFFAGQLLWRKLFKKTRCYWAELPIGLLAWRLLTLIPGVSFAVKLVSVPFGIGVLARLLGKKKPAPATPALPEEAE